jgi:hypothetical protein
VVSLYGSVIAAILLIMEHNRGFRVSTILGFYWLATTLVGAVQFYSVVERLQDDAHDSSLDKIQLRAPVSIAQFVGLVAMTILSSVREPAYVYEGDKPCPEISAGLLSIITFSWLNDLMALGYVPYPSGGHVRLSNRRAHASQPPGFFHISPFNDVSV